MAANRDRVRAAVPAEALEGSFPAISLPVRPPFPPMEARSASRLPSGEGWLFEPKWDGFRCLAFRKGKTVVLQSKHGQPLDRYFPELVEVFRALPWRAFVPVGAGLRRPVATDPPGGEPPECQPFRLPQTAV